MRPMLGGSRRLARELRQPAGGPPLTCSLEPATVYEVNAGQAADGNPLVTVTWRGGQYNVPYPAGLYLVVGDPVLLVVQAGGVCILTKVIGAPATAEYTAPETPATPPAPPATGGGKLFYGTVVSTPSGGSPTVNITLENGTAVTAYKSPELTYGISTGAHVFGVEAVLRGTNPPRITYLVVCRTFGVPPAIP